MCELLQLISVKVTVNPIERDEFADKDTGEKITIDPNNEIERIEMK